MKVYPESLTRQFNGKWFWERKSVAVSLAEKNPPFWRDFVILEAQLGIECGAKRPNPLFSVSLPEQMIYCMNIIAQKITPKPLSYPYTESNLAYHTQWPASGGSIGGESDSRNIDLPYSAAKTIQVIVEKAGDLLPEEAEIIRMLLNAPVAEVRAIAAKMACSTYTHHWRREIRNTGLIEATSDKWMYMQCLAIGAIASATEQSVLDGTSIEHISDPRLIRALLSFAKDDHKYDKSNAFYLLKVICSGSGCIDNAVQSLFIENIDSEDPYLRINSLQGIASILTRRKIDDRRLEDKLIRCASRYIDQQGVRDALRAIYFSLKSDRLKSSRLSSLSIVE